MFTEDERASLRSTLLDCAAADTRIVAAAITGSAAANREDRWSDIDLAFGVSAVAELSAVLDDWTIRMYDLHGAVHHVDVTAGAWIYRAFLLSSTLQVDLAFVAEEEFRPLGSAFRLVFGNANEPQTPPQPVFHDPVGLAWLYALHVRSAIARGNVPHAQSMLSGLRNQVLALAREPATASIPADLAEPLRAFTVLMDVLVAELRHADPQLASRLSGTLSRLSQEL